MMKTKKISSLRWIAKTAGKSKRWIWLMALVRVLQACTALVYAETLQKVVDIAASGRSADFGSIFLSFIGVVLISLILLVLGRHLSDKATTEMEKAYRSHTFSQLLCREYETVDSTHSGDWLTRIDSDVGVVVGAVVRIIPDLAGHLLRVTLVLVYLIKTIPIIVYIIVPVALLVGTGSLFFRKKMKLFHKRVQEANATMRSAIQERLGSLGVIHAFTQENNTIRQIDGTLDTVAKTKMKRSLFVNLCVSSISMGLFAAQAIGIGLCCWNIIQGNMTYGTMSAVLYLINQLETPLVNISSYISQSYAMLASAERLIEIEALPYDCQETEVSAERARTYYEQDFAGICLQKARFAYRSEPNNLIVHDLDMEVRKGEFVCFTGASGCGKSTTMKLLLNLYPLHGGSICLLNKDGTSQHLHAGWRSLFAYVPQGNHLFSGTLRQTLAFGDPSAAQQDERLWQALQIACADGFVRELPNGLDTVLGERGSGLSEGQMQRIAIARALLSQRPILLLDECTSALDNETEFALLKNLRSMTNRTVLTITHRTAALEFCDRQIEFYSNQENK